MALSTAGKIEKELPPLWDGVSTQPNLERPMYYIGLCEEYGILGRATQIQLVALGIAESGLDNLILGNNAKNGTDLDRPEAEHVAFGWLGMDSYWIMRNVETGQWQRDRDGFWMRQSPVNTLEYMATVNGFFFDKANGLDLLRTQAWASGSVERAKPGSLAWNICLDAWKAMNP